MGTLDVLGVGRRSLAVWARNIVAFALIGLVVQSPLIAFAALMPLDALGSRLWFRLVIALGPFVFGWVASAAVAYGVFQHLRGQPATIRECLFVGLRRLLPVVGVAIVTGLFVATTFVAAVWILAPRRPEAGTEARILGLVPGAVMMTFVYLAVPVAVVEGTGFAQSLRRSLALTKGSRAAVFGLIVLSGLVVYGTWGIEGWLLGKVLPRLLDRGPFAYRALALMQLSLRAVVETLGAVVPVVAYYELRSRKEHVEVEVMASVFD